MQIEHAAGLAVPGLGLGTYGRLGDAATDIVGAALAEGFRHIDTSRWYGNEAEVGRAIAQSSVRREDFWLTTKLLHPKSPPQPDIAAEMDESLRRLRTDHVDLLLIHWPRPDLDLDWVLGEFVALREAGKTRSIGVSNFPEELLLRARSIADGLVTNQVEYHPFLSQETQLATLRESDMFLTAHSPLARGAVFHEPIIDEIAATHGLSPVQVALRWLVQQSAVVAIPGAETVEQVRENLRVLTAQLADDEMRAIASLERGLRTVDPAHAPEWDRV